MARASCSRFQSSRRRWSGCARSHCGHESAPEHPVELRRDHRVAGLQDGQELCALRSVAERLAAADAVLDEHLLDRQPLHSGVAADDALLHVQALAFVGLGDGRDVGVAVDVAGGDRGGGVLAGGALAFGRRIEVAREAVGGLEITWAIGEMWD